MLLKTLLVLQAAQTGFDTHRVLALNVPEMSYGRTNDQIQEFYKETMRRISEPSPPDFLQPSASQLLQDAVSRTRTGELVKV